MAMDATARRRWFGGVVLGAALAMVACGDVVLKGKPGALVHLIYWLLCFGLTMVAIAVAFVDLRAVARRTRLEQQELFEATLRKIETEARSKARQPGGKGGEK